MLIINRNPTNAKEAFKDYFRLHAAKFFANWCLGLSHDFVFSLFNKNAKRKQMVLANGMAVESKQIWSVL